MLLRWSKGGKWLMAPIMQAPMFTLTRRILPCIVVGLAAALSSPVVEAEETKTVEMAIDYGDGAQKRFTGIVWREGLTVGDALDAATKHPRGIKYMKRGSGESTLLTQIDDLKNGVGGKYWTYEVSGERGDRSYAVKKLKAGDVVVWSFKEMK